MPTRPTADDLNRLLSECETALSTARKTIDARPSDLIAKAALPPLESSLRRLARDVRRWSGAAGADHHHRHHPPSAERFDQLRLFVRSSRAAIIDPQAEKAGLRVPGEARPARRRDGGTNADADVGADAGGAVYISALFFAQGLALRVLDGGVQTSPPWVGDVWVPHLAGLVAMYVLVLHHQMSWVPMFCYLVAQGLCVWLGCMLDLGDIIGLLVLVLAGVAVGSPLIDTVT